MMGENESGLHGWAADGLQSALVSAEHQLRAHPHSDFPLLFD